MDLIAISVHETIFTQYLIPCTESSHVGFILLGLLAVAVSLMLSGYDSNYLHLNYLTSHSISKLPCFSAFDS